MLHNSAMGLAKRQSIKGCNIKGHVPALRERIAVHGALPIPGSRRHTTCWLETKTG